MKQIKIMWYFAFFHVASAVKKERTEVTPELQSLLPLESKTAPSLPPLSPWILPYSLRLPWLGLVPRSLPDSLPPQPPPPQSVLQLQSPPLQPPSPLPLSPKQTPLPSQSQQPTPFPPPQPPPLPPPQPSLLPPPQPSLLPPPQPSPLPPPQPPPLPPPQPSLLPPPQPSLLPPPQPSLLPPPQPSPLPPPQPPPLPPPQPPPLPPPQPSLLPPPQPSLLPPPQPSLLPPPQPSPLPPPQPPPLPPPQPSLLPPPQPSLLSPPQPSLLPPPQPSLLPPPQPSLLPPPQPSLPPPPQPSLLPLYPSKPPLFSLLQSTSPVMLFSPPALQQSTSPAPPSLPPLIMTPSPTSQQPSSSSLLSPPSSISVMASQTLPKETIVPIPTPTKDIRYNCSALAAPATTGGSFGCLWCTNTTECKNTTQCDYFPSCPLHVVSSIFPTSGSLHGGTEVALGDLSLGNHSLTVQQVYIGGAECTLVTSGEHISCVTGKSAVVGSFYLNVLLTSLGGESMLISLLECIFTYAQPVLLSVFPSYGPLSGGTMVTIYGQALTVGNFENTAVFLNGVPCNMPKITVGGIQCISTKSSSVGNGLVEVLIDNSTVPNEGTVNYTYCSDPKFLSVFPNFTIPAGGVKLTFTGSNLNVVQSPIMVFYDGQITRTTTCKSIGNNTLQCTAPTLSQTANANGQTVQVNYTLIMDKAAGPNLTGALQLFTMPNPVFYHFNTTQYYIPNSLLQFFGKNVQSVQTSELLITIGSDACVIVYSTDSAVICQMPAQLSHKNILDVTVIVANGTLKYAIGTLNMELQQPSLYHVLIIVISTVVVVGGVVLVGIMLGIICCAVIVTKRLRSNNKRRSGSVNKRQEPIKQAEQIPLNPITSTCQTPFTESGEHVYEVIRDRKAKKDDSRLMRYDKPSTQSKYDVPSLSPKQEVPELNLSSYDVPPGTNASTKLELALEAEMSGEYVDMS